MQPTGLVGKRYNLSTLCVSRKEKLCTDEVGYLTTFLFPLEVEGFLWQIIDSLVWYLNQEAALTN